MTVRVVVVESVIETTIQAMVVSTERRFYRFRQRHSQWFWLCSGSPDLLQWNESGRGERIIIKKLMCITYHVSRDSHRSHLLVGNPINFNIVSFQLHPQISVLVFIRRRSNISSSSLIHTSQQQTMRIRRHCPSCYCAQLSRFQHLA